MKRGRPPKRTTLEPIVKPMDSGRVGIPEHFAEATGWIQGTEEIGVFLVMLSAGRYRVISATEADQDPDIVALKGRLESSSREANSSPLDFEDNSIATLTARFVSTDLSASGTEWRLSLPPLVTHILRIEPKAGNALLLMAGRYIEIWDIEVYRSSFGKALDEIIR
jgi:hypothetical protein